MMQISADFFDFIFIDLRRSAFSASSAFYLRSRRHERMLADKDENGMRNA